MKAIRVHAPGGAEVLRYEDVPDPVPGPGEALVRIAATGVNFIEVYQRNGQYAAPLPAIPGTEAAGTAEPRRPECDQVRHGAGAD